MTNFPAQYRGGFDAVYLWCPHILGATFWDKRSEGVGYDWLYGRSRR
jgi:hypothetical protein